MKRSTTKNLVSLFCLAVFALISLPAYAQFTTAGAYPFNASASTYTYLTGGTASTITSDDVYEGGIPIGFSFTFCGSTYTTVRVSSNGWLSFGSPTSSYLSNTTGSLSSITPVLMPLWDDLSGSGASPSYLTTGSAPNRVFTFEWRNFRWNYGGPNCISFQVKLYEDSRIEFLYNQEGSSLPSNASATIGIANSASDYKVLDNSNATPTPSTSNFTTTISSRPANGQSYMWGQPPCLYMPATVTASNITSSKATLNWTNNNSPQGYEYVVDQTAANPTGAGTPTNNTSVTISNLSPGTTYYAHVRGICSGNSVSTWQTISFTTTICIAPAVSMANINHNSATALWSSIPIATGYEYVLETSNTEPTSTTNTTITTVNSVYFSSLQPSTQYYLFIRSLCLNNEISDWDMTEFVTMQPCEAPAIVLSTQQNAVQWDANWQEVPTAVAYEYAVTSQSTPPSLGKTIYQNSINGDLPQDDKPYYLHVRTKCISIYNTSEWSTVTLREPPITGISNINANDTRVAAYPNPAHDMITITLDNKTANDNGNIIITDIAGKTLYQAAMTSGTLNVNLSGYAAGVYFVKYMSDGYEETIRINKQ